MKNIKGSVLHSAAKNLHVIWYGRHRIWEVFLQKIVGMAWDKVHEEAHRLEHSSSDDLINRLEILLRYPEFDPHGDPIPSKEGKMPKVKKHIPLSDLKGRESGSGYKRK